MSVYKYMTAQWGLDFVLKGQLKITPPAEFNDPFELQPPVPEMFTLEHLMSEFEASVNQLVIDELAGSLARASNFPMEAAQALAQALLGGPDSLAYKALVEQFRMFPGFSEPELHAIAATTRDMLPQLLDNARHHLQSVHPSINSMVAHGMRHSLPKMLGVLCVSKHSNHPLMWSHYADAHSGLMLELDASHACFNKRRSEVDELGFLRPVQYADKRPKLDMSAVNDERGFEVFALTKSSHWAYEDEQRLIWPLELCEIAANGKTRLFEVPPSAVHSVTLGCKATQETESELLRLVSRDKERRHIRIQRAKLHETDFALVYEPLATTVTG